MQTIVKYMAILVAASTVLCGYTDQKTLIAEAKTTEKIKISREVSVDTSLIPEQEELVAGYVDQVLYEDLYGDIMAYGNVGAARLSTAEEKKIYAALKEQIASVAAGNRTSTEFVIDVNFSWTAKELGVQWVTNSNVEDLVWNKLEQVVNVNKIIDYLLMDCPYELYWYDKTQYTYTSMSISYSDTFAEIPQIFIEMPVCEAFQNGSPYVFNASLANSAKQAKEKAASIVGANKNLEDYEKLLAYKNVICELVDYNDAANDAVPYGNPWQLLWVFDEDQSTKVVCEGYSKAFQYLCDLSGLTCYTVDGVLTGGTGAGNHMWNIVTLKGRNYLVDVTNCDAGTIGYPDKLFMSGTSRGNVKEGYKFPLPYEVGYFYGENQSSLLGEKTLVLATKNYLDIENSKLVEDKFLDVPADAWYKENAQYVYDQGIMMGSNGLFKPDESVKRSVIVTTLYRMAGEPEVTDDTACKVFSDVPVNEWYSDAVCWAYTTGITTGNTSTMKFNTNDYVTREQLAAFFYRYAKYMGEDVSARGDLSTMLNADQVKEYSKDAVCWAVGTGLISGKGVKDEAGNPAKDLAPQASATRAQLAAILQRFDEK